MLIERECFILDVGHQAEMLRLRRRFVKDQERTRIYFIKHQQRLAKAREVSWTISSFLGPKFHGYY